MRKVTVTLRRNFLDAFYIVLQIRGTEPVVRVRPVEGRSFEVRVGDNLTEEQVKQLGYIAELIVRGS